MSVLLSFICCKRANKTDITENDPDCLPGFIWIKYAGETNKIKRFTLIRTSENDSSFISYYIDEFHKDEWEGQDVWEELSKDFLYKYYCNNYIANSNQFYKIKNYIISNNTQKKYRTFDIDYSTVKIAVVDQCDSVEYIIKRENKGYFFNMIDSLEIKEVSLIEFLEYYEMIINTDEDDIYLPIEKIREKRIKLFQNRIK